MNKIKIPNTMSSMEIFSGAIMDNLKVIIIIYIYTVLSVTVILQRRDVRPLMLILYILYDRTVITNAVPHATIPYGNHRQAHACMCIL